MLYAKEANTTLHDKDERNVLTVSVVDSYISSGTTYMDEAFYEYIIKLKVDVSNVVVDECYLTLNYSNKSYSFNIGSFEVCENDREENILKITDLYGLSSEKELSLKAIVLTITNESNSGVYITDLFIGNGLRAILNEANVVEVSDDLVVEDYNFTLSNQERIKLNANEKKTIIIPINNDKKLYLSNCFITYKIGQKSYYLSNFTYIKSNDLNGLNPYLFKGKIYEL